MNFKSTDDVISLIALVGFNSSTFRPTKNEALFQDMVRNALRNLWTDNLFELARKVTGTSEENRILKNFFILHLMSFPERSYYDPQVVTKLCRSFITDEWTLRVWILD